MKLDAFVDKLTHTLGDNLKSIVLYGSAAAGDHAGKRSDYNTLVVLDDLALPALRALAPAARDWTRAGNPPPLLFTLQRLRDAADVFPIELLDMKDCRRVLYGIDVLEDTAVSRANLRLEIEHELRGKLIHLREQYLLTQGKAGRVANLMVDTLSTFQVLLRAVLRLYRDDVPRKKQEAIAMLTAHVPVDVAVFETLAALKAGDRKPRDVDADALFQKLLAAIEQVIDAVDKLPANT